MSQPFWRGFSLDTVVTCLPDILSSLADVEECSVMNNEIPRVMKVLKIAIGDRPKLLSMTFPHPLPGNSVGYFYQFFW